MVITLDRDKKINAWKLPEPVPGTPDEIRQWINVNTGMDMDEDGAVTFQSSDQWRQVRDVVAARLEGPR